MKFLCVLILCSALVAVNGQRTTKGPTGKPVTPNGKQQSVTPPQINPGSNTRRPQNPVTGGNFASVSLPQLNLGSNLRRRQNSVTGGNAPSVTPPQTNPGSNTRRPQNQVTGGNFPSVNPPQINPGSNTRRPQNPVTGGNFPSVNPPQINPGSNTRRPPNPVTGGSVPSVNPPQINPGSNTRRPPNAVTGGNVPSVNPPQINPGSNTRRPPNPVTGGNVPSVNPPQINPGSNTRRPPNPVTGGNVPSVNPPQINPGSNTRRPPNPVTGGNVPQPQPQVYSCPRECSYCQTFAKAQCLAFDTYGRILQSFFQRLPRQVAEAYNETSAMNTFITNAKMATCDGFMTYMRIWASLRIRVKDAVKDFLYDTSTVTPAMMEHFPREIYASLDPVLERDVYRNMTMAQKEVVCDDLQSDDCLVRKAILSNLDCTAILLNSGKTLSKNDMSALVDLTNYTNWDDAKWNMTIAHFATLLTYKHFESAPIDVLMDNMKPLVRFCGRLSRDTVKAIASRTKAKLLEIKSTSTIPADTKADWMDLLSKCGASPDYFDDVLDVQETISSVDMSKADPREAMKYMEKNQNALDVTTLNKDQILNFIKVLAFNKSRMMELDDTELELAACDICKKASDLDKSDMRKISDVLRKKRPNFTDPSSFDASKVECIGCMMPYFPKADFDQVPVVAMQGALTSGNMKNMTMKSRSKARSIMTMAKTAFNRPNGDFSSDDLKNMGASVLALKSTEVLDVPDGSFTDDVVDSLDTALKSGDMEVSKAVKAKFVEKIKNGAGLNKVLKTSLAKDIPTSYLQDADVSDFEDLAGENNESTIECNTKQARFLMKKVKTVVGDVSSGNQNFTLKRVSNILPYACGFTENDVANFAKDSSYLDILTKISESPCLTRGLSKKLYTERKSFTSFDTTDSSSLQADTTSASVSQMSAQILAHHSKTELDKYGSARCLDILEKIATANSKLLTKAELQDKWEFFVSCVGKIASTITPDDLKKAGNLICGITSKYIQALDADALDQYTEIIQKCTLNSNERQTLATTYLSKTGITRGSDMTSSSIVALGTTLANVPDTILNDVPDTVISDVAETVMKTFKEKEDSDNEREKAGFKQDLSDSDKTTYKARKVSFAKKVLSAKESSRAASASGLSGRRKRSTVSLTCSDLQSLGTTGLSALTTTQISNLDDQEFIDCAETLGSVTDYSDDQETALLAVATRSTVWGDPSTWASTNVYYAGVICQAMSVAQIETLNIDLDAVSRLGQFDGWDSLKKKAVYDRWLSLQKGGDSSTITSSELRSLGHVTCGAETGHISVIQTSVYQNAADAVGELTSCEDTQLQAFAALAKAAYGSDISNWDTTVVTNIGTTIGGLTASEISTLTEAQIDVVDPNHITYIPDTTFTGFSVNQINTFSTAQAQATTVAQRDALSSSQLTALSAVASVAWDSSSDSGAAILTGPGLMIMTLIALLMFYNN